jgi:hypothetical protein
MLIVKLISNPTHKGKTRVALRLWAHFQREKESYGKRTMKELKDDSLLDLEKFLLGSINYVGFKNRCIKSSHDLELKKQEYKNDPIIKVKI